MVSGWSLLAITSRWKSPVNGLKYEWSDFGNREITNRNPSFHEKSYRQKEADFMIISLRFDLTPLVLFLTPRPNPYSDACLRHCCCACYRHFILVQFCVSQQGATQFTGVAFCYTSDSLLTRLPAFYPTTAITVVEQIGVCIYTCRTIITRVLIWW